MLELLLMQYEMQFGYPFPLKECEDWAEIEVINLIYDCMQLNEPDRRERPVVNKFPTAPHSKAVMKSDIDSEKEYQNK